MEKPRLGILVGGGPAPGINGVIGAATIEAINRGLDVFGIYDGFRWLCQGDITQVEQLRIADVSRVHFQGGSILRTARDNPTRDPAVLERVADSLKQLGLDYLITIGGDDTAFSASRIATEMKGALSVAHVPKTIDNDLPLPNNVSTFGYQTARHVGVELVHNLMEDALTTSRWYMIETMGRKAGHLTLGIGKASGATLTVIAEEFGNEQISLDDVCDVIEGAIWKRRLMGHRDGVALIAEGIVERLDPDELVGVPGLQLEYDPHGHIELRDIPLARLLKQRIEARMADRGEKMTVVDVDIGYELRCAAPIPFDCEYVRDLGWGAVEYLLSGDYAGAAVVCLDESHIRPIPFERMMDPESGRTRVRMVDVNSESYRVALEYMIRLRPEDLDCADQLQRLASVAGMEPATFKQRFGNACRRV